MDNDVPILLTRLKNGSYKAFDCLYEQYFDLLYGFVFTLTRSHGQTRELVQETFIKVWIYRQKIDPSLSFKAWLYKMARNQLLDNFRKQWNDPLFEDYLAHCTDEKLAVNSEDDSFDYEAFRNSLIRAKTKLSPRQTEVFELCKEQGYSAPEVAAQLDISENVVYNYLSQAIAILRKEMNSHTRLFSILFL